MVDEFGSGPSNGMQLKAVENQSNNFYKATADYFCRIKGCKRFGKKIPKGFSHAHPAIKTPRKVWRR